MTRAVIIYSGGMDSFTTLHAARESGHTVQALSLNYGQRHVKELDYAKAECDRLGVKHTILSAQMLCHVLGGSALTDKTIAVPEGHYESETMKATVVPNRNMIILSLAIGIAVAEGADFVYTGVHAGDHAIYPDCRSEFIDAMNSVAAIANYTPVRIEAPFLHANKADILRYGLARNLDYGRSWTCYNGRSFACGKCGACQERLEAFATNNAIDPLVYEDSF